jgi:SOS-response transcriptional repressor LexA
MGAPLRHDRTKDRRLKPTMRSRKLQALDFIKRYFVEWGHSPSLDEIGAALDVSKQRASALVEQLSLDKQIHVVKGKRRGIELLDRGEQLSEADMLLRLKAMGFTVNPVAKIYGHPLTETGLPALPFLDHND